MEFSTNLETLIASLHTAERRIDAVNNSFARAETASQSYAASMEQAGTAAAASSEGFAALATNTVKATVDSLRLPTFLEFTFICPPTFAEQTAIANILTNMDNEIAALEEKLTKYKQIKTGAMQQLLTGKIRLPME